jgi:hypothetical protein
MKNEYAFKNFKNFLNEINKKDLTVKHKMNEEKLDISDVKTIHYARPENERGTADRLYKLYIFMKEGKEKANKWHPGTSDYKFNTIGEFNSAFGTSIPENLNRDPEGFVKEVNRLFPHIEVTLTEYDVS